jgi:hypothetical protein
VAPKSLSRPWTQKPPAAEVDRPKSKTCAFKALALWHVPAIHAVVPASSRSGLLAAWRRATREKGLDETAGRWSSSSSCACIYRYTHNQHRVG